MSLADYLASMHPEVLDYRIVAKSLDARGAQRGKKPVYHFELEVLTHEADTFEEYAENFPLLENSEDIPVIIGAGPAGLFCALRLAEHGLKSIIVEKGDEASKRMLHISRYWRHGVLNTESNVCFGEGGAGLFSDGKLITRIKSSYVKYVMQKFVDFGAPKEVAYLANPHLGSNKIRKIITKISQSLIQQGNKIIYNDAVKNIHFMDKKLTHVELKSGQKIKTNRVILATGHSAQDIYQALAQNEVAMQSKDFAVGVRIEHPRGALDQSQYGPYWEHELLGAAKYRVSHHDKESGRGHYSFCMCPGGYVLSSGTEVDGMVSNGMSNYARNSPWSNSALVVSVKRGEDFPVDDVLAGMHFQREIEKKAYALSLDQSDGKKMPAITVGEFLSGKIDWKKELPKTSCPSGLFKADFNKILPPFIIDGLKKSLHVFTRQVSVMSMSEALLIAPETRTSAPITILRDKQSLESLSHTGLYPCGEGAGYAGGITSAAVDGIKVAEAIVSEFLSAKKTVSKG